jgi:transposase
MDEPVCFGFRDALKRIAELKVQVTGLTRKFKEVTRLQTTSQTVPKRTTQTLPNSGGTRGHRSASLPDVCPHCCGSLVETGTAKQFQTEISKQPLLIHRFFIHPRRCTGRGAPLPVR